MLVSRALFATLFVAVASLSVLAVHVDEKRALGYSDVIKERRQSCSSDQQLCDEGK